MTLQIIILGLLAMVFIFLIEIIVLVSNKDNPHVKQRSKRLLTDAIIPIGVYCAFSVILMVNVFKMENSTPKVVETISQPQIDTTITIINGFADTTYTYTFPNFFVD